MSASPELLPTTLLARAWEWKARPFGIGDESGHQDSEHYSYDLRAIVDVSPDIEGLRVRVSEFINKLDNDPEGYGTMAANQLRADLSKHGLDVDPAPPKPEPGLISKIRKAFRR